MRLGGLLFLTMVLSGCASLSSLPLAPGATGPNAAGWQAPLGHDHPLVDTMVDTQTGEILSREALAARLSETEIIFVGETHDNPDHHLMQAWVIAQLGAAGRTPGVVFEMISMDQWEGLQNHLIRNRGNTSGLGRALAWEDRGWPDWEMYEPIAQAALFYDLDLVPGGPSNNTLAQTRQSGLTATLSPTMLAETGLLFPLSRSHQADLENQLIESHCGFIRSPQAKKMAEIQHLKDGMLVARALRQEDGAVIIAGNQHVRTDRGAPHNLRHAAPHVSSLSIGLIEVNAAQRRLEDITFPPYDIVWFTPTFPEVDYCAQFKAIKDQLSQPQAADEEAAE